MPNYPGKRPGTRRIVVWVKGKPKERVIRGTKTEGSLFEARWRVELEANQHDVRSVPTFRELSTLKYSPFAKANLARSTWRARKHVLVNLCEFFGKKKITQISASDTEAYKSERLDSGVSKGTINGEIRVMLTVLAWAKRNGYVVVFPAVRYYRVPKGRVRIWTRAQVDKLLRVTAAKRPQLTRLLVFLVNTGCRKGEAIAAEWSWMDFRRGTVRIPATEEWSPKNGEAREVPMSDECRAILELSEEERLSERWVFPNRDGVRFTVFPDGVFKPLQTKAGVSGGAHTLRHCFASFYLEKKPDLPALAKILGHSTTRTTELYAHLLPEHLETSRNAVNIGAPRTMVAGAGRTEKKRKTAQKTRVRDHLHLAISTL